MTDPAQSIEELRSTIPILRNLLDPVDAERGTRRSLGEALDDFIVEPECSRAWPAMPINRTGTQRTSTRRSAR